MQLKLFLTGLSLSVFACIPCTPTMLDTKMPDLHTSTDVPKENLVAYNKPPDLVGGYEFIKANLKYPKKALQSCLEARLLFEILISETGDVLNATALADDQGWGFNEAGLSVLRKSKWTPALKDGVPVKVRIAVPITFKIKT